MLAAFLVVPLILALLMGFFDVNIFLTQFDFVGLQNFVAAPSDDRFWNAMGNTLYFGALEVPLQIGLGLLVAALLTRNTKFNKAIRTIYFIPVVCSLTALGIMWSMMLDPVMGIGWIQTDLLNSPTWAMPTVVAITAWSNFGYTALILMAGIQGIPESYYEAAILDGASSVQRFFNITVPLLVPALGFCVITNIIKAFQVFDQIFIMTGGGPMRTTESIVQYIYTIGFSQPPYNLGYASAVSEFLLLLIFAITFILYRYFLRREEAAL